MIRSTRSACLSAGVILLTAATVFAQVGEPTGTFNITIQQGATTIVNANVGVPADHKISDGTPEGFVQIGSIGRENSPIILKMVTNDDPSFRIVHWYIDLPASLTDINTASGASLVNPADPSPVSVSITGLSFSDTDSVTPLIVNNGTFLTEYMRDTWMGDGGRFYSLPNSNFYVPGAIGTFAEAQVAGNQFLDGNASLYSFVGSFGQPTASWTWGAMPNPASVGAAAINADGSFSPGDGRVFELGLSVAFVGTPEPATIGFVLSSLIFFIRRR